MNRSFKADLGDWIKGRFLYLMRTHSRFITRKFSDKLYRKLVLLTPEQGQRYENALYQIFDVPSEKAQESFERLQDYKKAFKELEKDADKFYNSAEYTDQLNFYRNDHIQPRMPVQIDQVI